MLRDDIDDCIGCDRLPLLRGYEVSQGILCQLDIDRPPVVKSTESNQLDQRPFQLTNVGLDVGCNVLQDLIIHLVPFCLRFLLKNGHPGLVIRFFDICLKSPGKTVFQTVIQRVKFLWRSVRGDDNLLTLVEQIVERMEKFILCCVLSDDELNVIDQKNIDVAVLVAERIEHAYIVGILECGNQLIGKDLGGDIAHDLVRLCRDDVMRD